MIKNSLTLTWEKGKIAFAVLLAFVMSTLSANIAGALESATTSHTIKFNVYDTTALSNMIETCDSIKQDQEKNKTYTDESYNKLMEVCEGGKLTLECMENASANNLDASDCANPESEIGEIENAIVALVSNSTNNISPPNTDADVEWQIVMFGETYNIPPFTLISLSVAMVIAICVSIFFVRRHIKNRGIGGMKITNPWSDTVAEMIKKHENDPLTEIVDVSGIIRKYRIKFILWHTVPVLAIIGVFIVMLLLTASTGAVSEYTEINLTTTDGADTTIINIDKAVMSGLNTYTANIRTINTSIHGGGIIDEEGGVFVKYGTRPRELSSMGLVTEQFDPADNRLPYGSISDVDRLVIPSKFDSGTLNGENTFKHTVYIHLDFVELMSDGTYGIDLIYTITANEPPPIPPAPPIEPLATGCGLLGNNMGHVGSMQNFADTWEIYDYGIATDSRNGQDYYICKMPDGNVWMLNNLKISLFDAGNNPTLSNPGINVTTLSEQITPSTSGTSWEQPRYYDLSCGSVNEPSSPNCGNDDITSDHFYGYLYNWCAATGGAAETCTTDKEMPADSTTDICPANWRLPTGGDTGEFAWLNAKMNNPDATAPSTTGSTGYRENWRFSGPFRGVYSGIWNGGLSVPGSYGYIWSGSRYSTPSPAYNISYQSIVVSLADNAGRGNAFAVRCLLK